VAEHRMNTGPKNYPLTKPASTAWFRSLFFEKVQCSGAPLSL
jgi:hypothetical protein